MLITPTEKVNQIECVFNLDLLKFLKVSQKVTKVSEIVDQMGRIIENKKKF